MVLHGHDRLTGAPGEFAVLACRRCGLAFTVPRLTDADYETFYPDTYTDHLASESSGARRSPGEILEFLRLEAVVRFGLYRHVWRQPTGRLLDVGCGRGELAAVFARHGWSVSGIEPSPKAAEHARGIGIDVITGSFADAAWPAATFDAIIFNHSLEHIDDPFAALRRAADLLRPGGLITIAVPNFGSWHRRVFGSAWFQLDLPRHLQHFDRRSLTRLVERAGMRPLVVGAATMWPSPLGSLQYLAFGRMRYQGRGLLLAAWAIAPLLALIDRFAEGDSLHLVAER